MASCLVRGGVVAGNVVDPKSQSLKTRSAVAVVGAVGNEEGRDPVGLG
jgi:hypothetical protein